jgi:hypothetical protein
MQSEKSNLLDLLSSQISRPILRNTMGRVRETVFLVSLPWVRFNYPNTAIVALKRLGVVRWHIFGSLIL